jgi:hypothetical protein
MKPWYESKTIWVNILTLVAVIITSISAWPELGAIRRTACHRACRGEHRFATH